MTTIIQISPELVERFNAAAGLAREGDFEGSLAEWNRLLNPTGADKQATRFTTGDFLGQAYMRKAWVLMDLERWPEAREVLEDEVLQACLYQFNRENLYEYFFSYANTLGNLGEVEPMDTAFSKAMQVAAEHLGDAQRLHHCWNNLLYWVEKNEAWEYTLQEVEACIGLAANIESEALHELAMFNKTNALAKLGRKAEARSIVGPLMQAARESGNERNMARCAEIMEMIED